jgi:hypothetical protein
MARRRPHAAQERERQGSRGRQHPRAGGLDRDEASGAQIGAAWRCSVMLTDEEPAGRRLTGEPLRWRRHLKPEWDFIPVGSFRELEGVAWDCSDCGTTGALVLRAMRFHTYVLRCRNCHRQTELNGIVAEQIAVALGARAPRQSAGDQGLGRRRRQPAGEHRWQGASCRHECPARGSRGGANA